MKPLQPRIIVMEDDAPAFIEKINTIMEVLVYQYGIKEVSHIKIKNWFDHKWLNFSGKAVVPFEGLPPHHSALEDRWKDMITVPPFHPNRVMHEKYFRKHETNNKAFEKRLHRFRNSNENLQNYITRYTDSGLFIWYSSNSKANKRGSVMMYRVNGDEVHTFYASLENKGGWKIVRAKGINLNELKLFAKEK